MLGAYRRGNASMGSCLFQAVSHWDRLSPDGCPRPQSDAVPYFLFQDVKRVVGICGN
jgi:hypothetical protein